MIWAKWQYDAPGITTTTQEIDWGTGDTDKSRYILDNHTEGAQEFESFTAMRRLNTVAALDRAGGARLARLELDGGGDRKNREGESDEGGGAGEHCR